MSYTVLSATAVCAVVVVDLLVLRTRLLRTRQWWMAYGIVLVFQLVTNGWLTGRRIVTYDPTVILGSGDVVPVGSGRVAWAPVEDLGFGFALVLLTCVVWTALGARGSARAGEPRPGHDDDGAR